MQIVPLEDIRMFVDIKLRTMGKPARRHLGMDARYEREVVDEVMRQLEGCVVVRPSMVGFNSSMRHGEFGVDEPHPFPELLKSPPPPQR